MAQKRILIVEHESQVARLIELQLLHAGYAVSDIADSGEEALRIAGQVKPDLVLMDLQVAGRIDGVETASRMQVDLNIPVVFLTGLSDDATLHRSRASESFGYLVKPFREEALKASIELALRRHQSEGKQKNLEHSLAAAIKSISDAVLTTDAGGLITFANSAAEDLLGLSAQELLGVALEKGFPISSEHTGAPLESLVQKVLREGLSLDFPAPAAVLSHTGRRVFVEGSAAPIRGDQGQIVGAVINCRDVTERRAQEVRLAESETWLRAIIDSEPHCVKLVAADGTLLEMNPAGLSMVEADSAAQVLGSNLYPLVDPRHRAAFQEAIESTFRGETANLEFEILGLKGSKRWMETHAVPLRNRRGEVTASLGITRDITARKRSEFRGSQIASLGHALNSATTPLEAAHRIVKIADQVFGWDACYLDLYSAEQDLVFALLTMDEINGQRSHVPPSFDRCKPSPLQRRILEEGSQLALRRDDPLINAALTPFGDADRPSASLMFVPVRDGKRVIGILSIQSYKPEAYSSEDLLTLQSLADQCGGALERIRAQEALRESDERFHAFMNNSPVVAFIKQEDGRYVYGNQVWIDQFPKGTLPLGKTDAELWPELAARGFRETDSLALVANHPMEFTESGLKPNGLPFHCLVLKFIIRDTPGGKLLGGLAFDITERKQAEEKLSSSRAQLRSLAARLQSVREGERIRIAREIHDELGQMLTGFKMDLSWLERRFTEMNQESARLPLLNKMKTMSGLIDEMVQSVRRISAELRPRVLDDLGLVPAMEWQAREFETRTGLQCEFTPPAADLHLPPELCTAFFRIFQEALTNVARHARATCVTQNLQTPAHHLILEIHDNGRGITEEEVANSQSLGLLGMRERALILGGNVQISGTPGQGTTVRVEAPLA